MAEIKDIERKQIKFTSPKLALIWPRLQEPDTKWKPEGEYSAKGAFDLEDFNKKTYAAIEKLLADYTEEVKKLLKPAKLKTLKVAPIFKQELDKDTGDETGKLMFHAKLKASGTSKKTGKPWTAKPDIFDAKQKSLVVKGQIWGGTEAKLAGTVSPYYAANDNTVGVTFRLEAAQILKLVTGQSRDAKGYGFAEEEGYSDDDSGGRFDDETGGQFDDSDQGNDIPSGPENQDF